MAAAEGALQHLVRNKALLRGMAGVINAARAGREAPMPNVEVRPIGAGDPRVALRGQLGLFAKEQLPPWTLLGASTAGAGPPHGTSARGVTIRRRADQNG